MRLTSEETSFAASPRSVDADAYEAYLKGRHYWDKRTRNGLKRALKYFNYAIARDPTCAEALAGLADLYTMMGYWQMSRITPIEAFESARSTAQRALEIDGGLAEAYTSLGFVKAAFEFDWQVAEDCFKKALQLKPNYSAARYWYASTCLATRGHHQAAIEQCKEALKTDSLSGVLRVALAWCFYLARQFDAAIEQARKSLELNPRFAVAHFTIGVAYEQQKNYREAIAELQRAVAYSGANPIMLAALAHAYAVSGSRRKARKLIDELPVVSTGGHLSPYDLSLIHVGLGQHHQALDYLQSSVGSSAWLIYAGVEPRFDPVRNDLRFQSLLRQINMIKRSPTMRDIPTTRPVS